MINKEESLMIKMKVMTIIGTRPEIIRLSEVIKACDLEFDHVLVHTGQNYDYELNQIFFDDLELRQPDYFLKCAGSNLGATIGKVIERSYELIRDLKPDAVLILGDTNSALAAIAAKRLKCPIFHMEAGNRCGDWNVPETINRKIVDHIADFNLPYTDYSYRYLIKEGLEDAYIEITGSPILEVLKAHASKIELSDIHTRLGISPKSYIVLSWHREENIDIQNHFQEISNAIEEVIKKYQMPIIFSCHPRTFKKLEENKIVFHPLIKKIKPLGFTDYCRLQKDAFIVISDSGTVSEESAMLRFRAILMRTSTERPEAIDAGTIILSGIDATGTIAAIEAMQKKEPQQYQIPHYYTIEDVSHRVVNIIKNKVSFINETIWRKKTNMLSRVVNPYEVNDK
jgi:UDP-N-acetyl-L-fucosamine synthase